MEGKPLPCPKQAERGYLGSISLDPHQVAFRS